MQNIEDMMSTEDFQYVIIQANDSYFGFHLFDEVERASIFSIIHTKQYDDIIYGWMVSKVMPPWVGTNSDWLAFEEQVCHVKIPKSVSYYNDSEKSSRKSDNSRSSSSENTFSDTEQNIVNVSSLPRKRLGKPSKYVLSSSDADDADEDEEPLKTKLDPICDWAIEGRCNQSIVPKRCQYSRGCDKYVHHLCTIEWATENGIEESSILTLCRKHHPEYQHKCNTKQQFKPDTKWSCCQKLKDIIEKREINIKIIAKTPELESQQEITLTGKKISLRRRIVMKIQQMKMIPNMIFSNQICLNSA